LRSKPIILPDRIPEIIVEMTGIFVFLLTFEKNEGIKPSCDRAYSRRGSGIIAIIVHPKIISYSENSWICFNSSKSMAAPNGSSNIQGTAAVSTLAQCSMHTGSTPTPTNKTLNVRNLHIISTFNVRTLNTLIKPTA